MPFDLKRFEQAEFSDRVEGVELSALAGFFDDDEKPIWQVRGLTHAELSQAAVSMDATKNVDALVNALTGSSKVKAEAIKRLLGVAGDEVPQETKKRLEYLVMGSVDPAVTLDIAVKLAHTYPIEFGLLTNKILQLTGQGKVLAEVKQKPSGK